MKLENGTALKILGDEVNYWQVPVAVPNWQDSVVLTWWDSGNEVGGFHRIGFEPNHPDGPKIALWSHLASPQGTYKRVEVLPLRDEDRLDNGGFAAGDTCRYEFQDGLHVWTIADDEVNGVIRLRDFHAHVECYPKDSSLTEEFANIHTDIPGGIEGEMNMGGAHYTLKGLGFRDRGWGVREWDYLLSHRWVAGTLGEDIGFLALSYYGADDTLAAFGWIVRNDTVYYAKRVDIVTYTEIDSVSNRGGHVTLELNSGETFEIECRKVAPQSFVSYHHDICCVDTLCEARWGGRVGFCDFESSGNIQAGKREPRRFFAAAADNGFFPAK